MYQFALALLLAVTLGSGWSRAGEYVYMTPNQMRGFLEQLRTVPCWRLNIDRLAKLIERGTDWTEAGPFVRVDVAFYRAALKDLHEHLSDPRP